MMLCEFCNKTEGEPNDNSGKVVCEECLYDLCGRCEGRLGEYEVRNNTWCLDCYTGLADDLYERMKDHD